MDRVEAFAVLGQQLALWRSRSYSDLAAQIGTCAHLDIAGPSRTIYQVDIEPIWDDLPGGIIRVLGLIDDGGIRAFAPLGDDFLIAPDGTFVDEQAV